MRKWLLAISSAFLALSVVGCAHQTGGGYAGVGYYDECEPGYDCYGGYQYTCVFYEPPVSPSRLEIHLAHHDHYTRVVGSRGEGPGSSASGSPSGSASAASMPTVAREPVVAPAVDRGSPRVRN